MLDLRTGQKPDEVAREKGYDDIANDILAYPDGPFEAISEQMDTAAARWDDARAVALPPPETGDRFDYKWLDEECAYAAKLRQLYDRGVLRLAKGTRLAEFPKSGNGEFPQQFFEKLPSRPPRGQRPP